MKKMLLGLLAVLLALSVCACSAGGEDAVYTVTKNGVDYVVDTENGTISDGTYTYQYTFSGNASGYNIEITYPDGSAYSWNMHSSGGWSFGGGGGSEDYDPDRYVGGDVLCDILEAGVPAESSLGMMLAAVLLLAVGLFNLISPRKAWYMRCGWRFKDTEPSELALVVGCVSGAVIAIVAVILFLSSL